MHCHDSSNPYDNHILKFKFEAGKSLNNQDLMISKCCENKNSGSYRYLTQHDEQDDDGKKDQNAIQVC